MHKYKFPGRQWCVDQHTRSRLRQHHIWTACLYRFLTLHISPITLGIYSFPTDHLIGKTTVTRRSCQVLWFYITWQWLHCDADIGAVYCHTYCKALRTNKITVMRGNWELNTFPTCSFSRADLYKAMWALPELRKLQKFICEPGSRTTSNLLPPGLE